MEGKGNHGLRPSSTAAPAVTIDDVVRLVAADPRHETGSRRRRGEVAAGIVLAAAYGLDAYLPACPERDAALRGLVAVHEQAQAAIAHG